MPEQADPLFLLEWAGELGKTYPFVDFHAHPFDVFSGSTDYQASPVIEGLFTKGASAYHAPSRNLQPETPNPGRRNGEGCKSQRVLLLASRLAYLHTGPKVFLDQLDLAGIAGALLLPVARLPGIAREMVEASSRLFPRNDRLLLGCPFPVGVAPADLDHYYRWAYDTAGIRAVKIHPNLSGIDPATDTGLDLFEATLEAAGQLDLPVLVHAGRTAGLDPVESQYYGSLARLVRINWSLSSAPVILAHAGCYGLSMEEVSAVIPLLERLLERFPNLLVDNSALELPILSLLFARIDRSRFIFGSDALYFPVWKSWLAFLQALYCVSTHPDDDLICIASLNPARCLGMNIPA